MTQLPYVKAQRNHHTLLPLHSSHWLSCCEANYWSFSIPVHLIICITEQSMSSAPFQISQLFDWVGRGGYYCVCVCLRVMVLWFRFFPLNLPCLTILPLMQPISSSRFCNLESEMQINLSIYKELMSIIIHISCQHSISFQMTFGLKRHKLCKILKGLNHLPLPSPWVLGQKPWLHKPGPITACRLKIVRLKIMFSIRLL